MIDLSVLILVPSAGRERVAACLQSLARTLPCRVRVETLLVPAEGGAGWSDEFGAVLPPGSWRVLPTGLSGSRSLATTRNAAVAAARGTVLCFLDPGAVLLLGWLPPMLALLRRAPGAGCVGNIHREPYSGLIDHAGLRFRADGFPTPGRSRALLPHEPYDRHPAVSFACALVTRETFARVGGFDPRFHGPLGEVDFCLRAASAGFRHYVHNRSVVYHAPDPAPNPFAVADLARFRTRWGERARAAHLRRADLRRQTAPALYSLEKWEISRDARRLWRQQIRDTRRHGLTYLGKHLHRPWRYNYRRICRALVQALAPLPSAFPVTPGGAFHNFTDTARPDDGWLFDPPTQERDGLALPPVS